MERLLLQYINSNSRWIRLWTSHLSRARPLLLSSFVHFKSDSEGNNALSNLNGAWMWLYWESNICNNVQRPSELFRILQHLTRTCTFNKHWENSYLSLAPSLEPRGEEPPERPDDAAQEADDEGVGGEGGGAGGVEAAEELEDNESINTERKVFALEFMQWEGHIGLHECLLWAEGLNWSMIMHT